MQGTPLRDIEQMLLRRADSFLSVGDNWIIK